MYVHEHETWQRGRGEKMKTKKIKEGASEKEKVDKMTRRREIHHGTKQIGTLLWFWLGMLSRFWRTRSSQ